MNTKYTLPEFLEWMSNGSEVDKKGLDQFAKTFFALIEEALLRDKVVKISALGTFKLQKLERRRSVHVQTGQALEIPEHYKVVYQPTKELSERVNGLFSAFESVEIDHLELTLDSPSTTAEPEPFESTRPDEALPLPSPMDSEAVNLGDMAKQPLPQAEPVVSSRSEPLQPLPLSNSTPKRLVRAKSKRGSNRGAYLLFILVLLLGGGFIYLAYYLGSGSRVTSATNREPVLPPLDTTRYIQELLLDTTKIAPPIETEEVTAPFVSHVSTATVDSTQQKEEVTYDHVGKGESLTTVSLRNYGHKAFWIYIYEENKQKIKSPNRVSYGMKLLIPPPSKYGIDPNNPLSVEKAQTKGDLFFANQPQ